MKSVREGLLQQADTRVGQCWMHVIGSQLPTGCRSAQAGKDGPGERDAHALPDGAARCQKAGGAPLVAARSRTHQRAVVGRLEQGLPRAGEDQTPDDIERRAVRVQLAHEHQPGAGDYQTGGSQPARADAVGQHTAEGRNDGDGQRKGCKQQPGLQGGVAEQFFQVKGEQEAYRGERQKTQNQTDIGGEKDAAAQQDAVDNWVGDVPLHHDQPHETQRA